MKKTIAFLFAALAVLSSSVATGGQRLNIIGYRIGDTQITSNDGRIIATNLNNEVKTDIIELTPRRLNSNAWFNITVPAGQEVRRWLAFNGDPGYKPPSQTNNLAGAVTQYVWSYDEKDAADKYIVVDFDYITYTLNYNANTGSGSMSSENHIYTNNFNLVANAFTKTGYTFTGWTNSVVTTALRDGAQITDGSTFGVTYTNKATTLYANWNANSYSVRFNKNADDATGSMDDQQFIYDVAQNLSNNAFARNGYIFGGWTNSTGTVYADGASVSNLASDEGAVVDLFAKWTHIWTITFKEADQFGGGTISSATYEDGSTVTPPVDPQHEGWRFDGWGSDFSTTATKDATYEARYTAKTYALTYHANYGEDTIFSTWFSYGTTVNIPKTMQGITSRTGYTMQGWAFSPDAAEIAYEPGETGVMFTTAGSVELYAVWAPIEYTIAFDGNGGEGTMSAMLGVKYDVVTNLTPNAFTNTGVEFKHWLFGSAVYENCAPVSNLTATAGATVTMTAVWSEKCYVAYDGNGGGGEMETQTFDAETLPQSLTSNAFTKVGYTFGGWATNSTEAADLVVRYEDGQEFTTFASLPASAGETATLFAVWQTNSYTVIFNPNCNKYAGEMAAMELFYDQSTNLTDNAFVNEAGLHFSGWSNTVTGVTYADNDEIVNLASENGTTVTLNAIWDNGELSRAMHCDNLYWEAFPEQESNCWKPMIEPDAGYFSDSCVTTNGATNPLVYMVANIKTNGVLRFMWKADKVPDQDRNYGLRVATYLTLGSAATDFYTDFGLLERTAAEANDKTWLDSGDIIITPEMFNGQSEIWLCIRSRRQACFIDQLTWTPAGASVEPTEDDKPVISGFESATTETGSGFRIQISNASSDFDYQILGTNVLTTTEEWPVIETLSGSKMNEGYTIEFDEDEPQMFYKVKVISK